jgi:flagellin
MSSGILLSGGLRSSVNSLTDIGGQIATANTRLSTGKKVNTAIDDPGTYFKAKGFESDTNNLKALLDNQNLGLSTITKANDAISQVTKLVQSIQALIKQAQNLSSAAGSGRDTIGSQIATTFNQIDSLTRDSGFNGTQVLYNSSNTAATFTTYAAVSSSNLNVITNSQVSAASQTTIRVGAIDAGINSAIAGGIFSNGAASILTPATTGLTYLTSAGNAIVDGSTGASFTVANFDAVAGDGKLAALAAAVGNTLNKLTAAATAVSTQATILQVRQAFTTSSARTSQAANESLILADLNEEGAALTSLQTRQSFAVTSLQLAGQADKAILRLFG